MQARARLAEFTEGAITLARLNSVASRVASAEDEEGAQEGGRECATLEDDRDHDETDGATSEPAAAGVVDGVGCSESADGASGSARTGPSDPAEGGVVSGSGVEVVVGKDDDEGDAGEGERATVDADDRGARNDSAGAMPDEEEGVAEAPGHTGDDSCEADGGR